MTRKIVSLDDIDGIHDDDVEEYIDNYNEMTEEERAEIEAEMDARFAELPWYERVRLFFTFDLHFMILDFFVSLARFFLFY